MIERRFEIQQSEQSTDRAMDPDVETAGFEQPGCCFNNKLAA